MQFNVSPRKHTQQPLHLTKPSIAYYSYQLQSVPPINVTAALAILPACASLLCSFFVSLLLCITLYLYHIFVSFNSILTRSSSQLHPTNLSDFTQHISFTSILCSFSHPSTLFFYKLFHFFSHFIHPSHPLISSHPSLSSLSLTSSIPLIPSFHVIQLFYLLPLFSVYLFFYHFYYLLQSPPSIGEPRRNLRQRHPRYNRQHYLLTWEE